MLIEVFKRKEVYNSNHVSLLHQTEGRGSRPPGAALAPRGSDSVADFWRYKQRKRNIYNLTSYDNKTNTRTVLHCQ